MSKALEIDSSRRSLLKYTVAGLLAGFGGRLLPHVSSAYAATEGGAKALVVYYSRSGNTRAVAEAIHAAVGGDIVELQPVTPYPEAYRATTDQAKQELASEEQDRAHRGVRRRFRGIAQLVGHCSRAGEDVPVRVRFGGQADCPVHHA